MNSVSTAEETLLRYRASWAEAAKRYRQSEKGKAAIKRYRSSPEALAKRRAAYAANPAKVAKMNASRRAANASDSAGRDRRNAQRRLLYRLKKGLSSTPALDNNT